MKPTIKTLIELLFEFRDDYSKQLQLTLIENAEKTLPEIWEAVQAIDIPHKKFSRMYDRHINDLLLKIADNYNVVSSLQA